MILIIGATSTAGIQTANQLRGAATPVRVILGEADLAGPFHEMGHEVLTPDLGTPDTYTDAFDGIDTLFLSLPPTEEMRDLEREIIQQAREAEVRRIVRVSLLGATADSQARLFREHGQIDAHLRETCPACTILRPAMFMQDLIWQRDTIKNRRVIQMPFSAERIALLDARDLGAVAVKILTGNGAHHGQTYDLTGPEALDFATIAEVFTRVLEGMVEFESIPDEEMAAHLRDASWTEWDVAGMIELYTACRNGWADAPTDTVAALLGRPATPIDAFARDHAPAFR